MNQPERPRTTIAVLGGTGNEGPGLALRWAQAGHRVIIGSRRAEKAQRVAGELNEKLGAAGSGGHEIEGMANPDAADACDVAVLTVPYGAQNALLETLREPLQGKMLINVNVAMKPPKVARVYIPPEGSASEQAQAILGDGVTRRRRLPERLGAARSKTRTIPSTATSSSAATRRRPSHRHPTRRGHRHARHRRRPAGQRQSRRSLHIRPHRHQHPLQSAGVGHPHHGPGGASY